MLYELIIVFPHLYDLIIILCFFFSLACFPFHIKWNSCNGRQAIYNKVQSTSS